MNAEPQPEVTTGSTAPTGQESSGCPGVCKIYGYHTWDCLSLRNPAPRKRIRRRSTG